MEKRIAIYFAGKIHKEHEIADEAYWTKDDLEEIERLMAPHQVSFLNPAVRADDMCDQKSVFGRDMTQVYSADAVFVDARDRRGLGVGAEMMWAKVNRIPVITLAPAETHYNKSNTKLLGVPVPNYVHPFVENLSDAIVEDLAEGCRAILHLIDRPEEVRSTDEVFAAMDYYRTTQFNKDAPMKELASIHQSLHQRIHEF